MREKGIGIALDYIQLYIYTKKSRWLPVFLWLGTHHAEKELKDMEKMARCTFLVPSQRVLPDRTRSSRIDCNPRGPVECNFA
jgi:hypothetical protein